MKLLTIASDAKTVKSIAHGWLTAVLYLEPGAEDICPHAVPACRAVCLATAGRGGHPGSFVARKRRTELLRRASDLFVDLLNQELETFANRAGRHALQPCARLNGTSDLAWRRVFERHPQILFYDYTKSAARMRQWLRGEWPENVHLTFSWSGFNGEICAEVLRADGNVAIVVDQGVELPVGLRNFPTVNGDAHDMRWTDPPGHLVCLRPKGRALLGGRWDRVAHFAREQRFVIAGASASTTNTENSE